MSEEVTIVNEDGIIELERLETIVRRCITSFSEAGKALAEIRDKKLYLEVKGYDTFEAYCRAEWDYAARTVYQLIDAAKVIENVRHGAQTAIIPENERQARPLVKLNPDQQREAWLKAIQTAPEGGVTARHVYKIVKEMTEEKKEPGETAPEGKVTAKHIEETVSKMNQKKGYIYTETYPVSDAMAFVTMAISQLERIRPNDPKREEAFLKVIRWVEKKKEPEKKKPIFRLDVPGEPELISPKFQAAFEAMVSAIKNEKGLKWKETSKKDALKCVGILADIITI